MIVAMDRVTTAGSGSTGGAGDEQGATIAPLRYRFANILYDGLVVPAVWVMTTAACSSWGIASVDSP